MMQQNKFTSQEIMMQARVRMCIYPVDGEASCWHGIAPNTLECARSHDDRQDDQHQQNPEQAGLTGAADLSDRCRQGFTKA